MGTSRVRTWIGRSVLLGLALATLGCGHSSTSPSSGGTLTVRLTDSPFADARAVLVSFSEVSAHLSGSGGFSVLASGSRTCDLKKLVGAQDVLGTGPLAAGHYTQIRLLISSATLYFEAPSSGPACAAAIAAPSGRSAPVEVPSGEIRLNREFDVTTGNVTTLTLDFDGDRSITQTGNGAFVLNPVIAVVSVQ